MNQLCRSVTRRRTLMMMVRWKTDLTCGIYEFTNHQEGKECAACAASSPTQRSQSNRRQKQAVVFEMARIKADRSGSKTCEKNEQNRCKRMRMSEQAKECSTAKESAVRDSVNSISRCRVQCATCWAHKQARGRCKSKEAWTTWSFQPSVFAWRKDKKALD